MYTHTSLYGIIKGGSRGETTEENEYFTKAILNHLPTKEFRVNEAMYHDGYGLHWYVNTCATEGTYTCYDPIYDRMVSYDEAPICNKTTSLITLDGRFPLSYQSFRKPFMKWLCRLAKRFCIYGIYIYISDGMDEYIIHEPDNIKDIGPWYRMYEYDDPWVKRLGGFNA